LVVTGAQPSIAREDRPPVELVTQDVLDRAEAEVFYDVYLRAFGELRRQAAARQVLTKEEFLEEMTDARVTKYVVRAEDGEALGLATLVTALDVVPWISPEYYAERYPEQARRSAIYYVGFMLSHPDRRSLTAYPMMVHAILARCVQERAALLWDICGFNEDLGFAGSLGTLVKRQTGAVVEALDRQTYYGVAFT
jgi:hypothetical protein